MAEAASDQRRWIENERSSVRGSGIRTSLADAETGLWGGQLERNAGVFRYREAEDERSTFVH